jgi:putative nucleotidyltransferase with HDIG domain
MGRYQMLPNIKEHSLVVAKIAALIAGQLAGHDAELSVQKTIAGALLHDIGKTACLNTTDDHAARGAEICVAEQLPAIVDIVAQHVILRNYDSSARLTERELVYYADKRVNHDQIVSLEERMEYILANYGRNNDRLGDAIRENFKRCRIIEVRIFAGLDFKPDDLKGKAAAVTLL